MKHSSDTRIPKQRGTNAGAFLRAAELRDMLREAGSTITWKWSKLNAEEHRVRQLLLEHFAYHELELPQETYVGVELIEFGERELVTFSFAPDQTRGWVVLLHGYMLHSLCLSDCIRYLVQQGYAVVAPDWPGHGLSSCERANIPSFTVYADALACLVCHCQDRFASQPHVIAHSTGCSAWLTFDQRNAFDLFATVVLVSPLLRNAAWHWSRWGTLFASRWLSSVPRMFRKSSSDRAYLDRMRQDKLAPWSLPLQWSKALIQWESGISALEPGPRRIWVLQGDSDTVVDWRFGLKRIRELYPEAQVFLWKGQKHDLLSESRPVRDKVFNLIKEIFEGRRNSDSPGIANADP